MSVPPPLPAEPRKGLGTGAIVAIVAGSVVTLLVLAAVVVGLVAFTSQRPEPTADDSPVVTGSQAPVGPRAAFYTFAHTAVSVQASEWGLGERIQVQRVRFTATADADAFSLQMRNYRYIDDTAMTGTIAIDAAYVGLATDDVARSDFAEPPVRVLGATELVDGNLVASGWIGTDDLSLEAGRDYIVSIAMRMSPDQEIAVAGDESWQAVTDDAADAGSQVLETAHVLTANMLDMQVRYSLSGDEPIVAAIGHSGNTGANQRVDIHPHSGESSGWPQIWAQQQGGVVSSLAVAGSWIAQYPADSTKWELADDTDADVVSIFAASSDLVGGAGVDLVRSEWEATIARAQEAWPDARIVAWTEPPRGASGEGEAAREEWNAFIRSMPDGVDAVVDADALLADPADATRIVPRLDGDGTHPSIEGHQAVADLFAQTMRELGY